MRGQVLLALGAMAATLALAQPASAEQYRPNYDEQRQCEQARNGRTAGGAIIGAILGAVIGNNVAGDQSDGSVAGAVLGGVAGGAIARNSVRCDAQGDAYYRDQPYGDRRDDSGLYGGPDYRNAGPDYREARYGQRACEWRNVRSRDEWGRTHRERVYFCQGRDGRWRPQG